MEPQQRLSALDHRSSCNLALCHGGPQVCKGLAAEQVTRQKFGSGEDFRELVTSLPYYYTAVGFESREWWKQKLGTTKLYKIPKTGGETSQWAGHRLWFPLPMWKAPWQQVTYRLLSSPWNEGQICPQSCGGQLHASSLTFRAGITIPVSYE